MTKKEKLTNAIQHIIKSLIYNVMHKVPVDDPFIAKIHRVKKTLYAALVPDEIFKESHFERRFVTPFVNAWGKLAIAAASAVSIKAEQGHTIEGVIPSGRLKRITSVLNQLEHPILNKNGRKIKLKWNYELKYILQGK